MFCPVTSLGLVQVPLRFEIIDLPADATGVVGIVRANLRNKLIRLILYAVFNQVHVKQGHCGESTILFTFLIKLHHRPSFLAG